MGANKGRRAKNLFKSYYVGFDKAVADPPEIIEKHVYYHPEKGIQKTVYYPGAEKGTMGTIPEGAEHATPGQRDEGRGSAGASTAIPSGTRNVRGVEESGEQESVEEHQPEAAPPRPCTREPEEADEPVNAASAFQRWRQFHLQRTFNQELRRVSEVSRKDVANMAMVEQERAQREKGLAFALAESASLRAQLTAKEQEIQALQSHKPAGDRRAGKVAALSSEDEPEPSDRRSSQRNLESPTEDLVWIDQPSVARQNNQEFAGLSHSLHNLVGEVTDLENRAGDMVSFTELHEAFRNIERNIESKRRSSQRPKQSDSRRQALEYNDYLRRRYRGQDDYRDYRNADETVTWSRKPSKDVSHHSRRGHQEAGYMAGNMSLLEKVGKAVVWKWRWALAVSKGKTLSRHLKSLKALYKAQLSRTISSEGTSSSVSAHDITFRGSMERTLLSTLPHYSMVSFVVSLWRAYTSCTKTQKVFLSRLIPIDKIMAAFPLWIEKTGDHQILEYFFSLWQYVVSRKTRRSRGNNASPRRSPRRRNYHHDPGPSIYESFHHCCHPNSPTEANRQSPTRVKSPRAHGETRPASSKLTTQRSHHRHAKKEPPDVPPEEETDTTTRCASHAAAECNNCKAEAATNHNKDGTANNDGSPAGGFDPSGINEMLQGTSVPNVPLTGQTFSAQALRRLQMQLQHELQDMQPLLAKATKAIQDQVVLDGRCANSMASLWKICSTVEYALTEARNQMLSIIQESARGYHNGWEMEEQVDRFLPEGVVPYNQDFVEVDRLENTSRKSCGFPNVFSLISRTSGLHNLRRKSCLAAQYAVGLNHKLHQIKEQPRTWQT